MHGKDVFTDPARVARAIAIMYGISQDEALPIAKDMIDLLAQDPKLDNGGHPLFSLNAMAFPGMGSDGPTGAPVPPKLIMGDGLLQVEAGLGLDGTAPRGILAHEFGHHVQYEDNLMPEGEDTPASTRKVELQADAFSAYFLVHARGQALNTKRTLEAEKSFFESGDCDVDRLGHHGTPSQRLASATWAAGVANAARPQGKILPARTFASMFDAKLPELLAD
jgi:hypothetical protein